MESNNVFTYQYSAAQNREVEYIRKKYLTREESKIEVLRRLDNRVQSAGIIPSLCLGVIGALIFGIGVCFGLDVLAVEDSAVIFFDIRRIMTVCSSACRFHSMVVHNLFFAISEKNRKLVQKLGHISKRTTREKLISYLSEESKKHNSPSFTIPFNRQQLADFLSVDRSAMSNELCKMRDEGLLEFERNQFKLL